MGDCLYHSSLSQIEMPFAIAIRQVPLLFNGHSAFDRESKFLWWGKLTFAPSHTGVDVLCHRLKIQASSIGSIAFQSLHFNLTLKPPCLCSNFQSFQISEVLVMEHRARTWTINHGQSCGLKTRDAATCSILDLTKVWTQYCLENIPYSLVSC